MEETMNSEHDQSIKKEAPQLAGLLKEMKEGLDVVRSKVQALTAKVKAGNFPTADGISYLEAKHLLLLSYCQSIVYYLLRKAKGLSIEGHPVVQSLVEIRLFLEKVRPIDKKLEFQIQKLIRDAECTREQAGLKETESMATQKSEDWMNYKPNPDLLIRKSDMMSEDGGVYRPPKIAPTVMEEDKMSKQERNALRREKETLRRATQGYMKELIDNIEERPEEVKESIGTESMEFIRYQEQWEKRAQQEEELFTRASLTKWEKKEEKHLKEVKKWVAWFD